jgi:outer membrane protein OmpA-like peptidoglycan-associated protein
VQTGVHLRRRRDREDEMTKLRAFLLGGACLSLFSLQASTDSSGRMIADAIKSRVSALQQMRSDLRLVQVAAADEKSGEGAASNAAPSAEAPKVNYVESHPADPVPGVTWYPGETKHAEDQPFAAPATVFVTAGDATTEAVGAQPETAAAGSEASVAAAPVFVPAPINYVESHPADPVPGVTWYPGETKSAEGQPFSAPATVYGSAPEAATTEATAIEAAVAPVFVPAPINYVESNPGPAVPGVTWYPGETKRAEDQAFSAPAKMMPVEAATPAPVAAPAPAATTRVADACRDQLNATVQSGRILFGTGSWDIRPESFKTLGKLASIAKGCQAVVIEVGGHTDNTGSVAGNETLSKLRAEAVAKYLAKAGVDAAKLKSAGYGQSQPLATNSTAEGRQKNRRIEFLVTGG